MKVHVADDDADIRESTLMLLDALGHEATASATADRIVPDLLSIQPDVLLQDVHMPSLNVALLMKQIRHDPVLHALPVLIFTATVEAGSFWREIGASGVLGKPFSPDALEAELQRIQAGPEADLRASAGHA